MDKIKFINITKDDSGIPTKAEVVNESGYSYIVEGKDNIKNEIIKFGLQEGIFPGELIKNTKYVRVVETEKVEEKPAPPTIEEPKKTKPTPSKVTIKSETGSKKGRKIVITCVVAAGILALSSIPSVINRENKYKQARNDTPIVQKYTYGNTNNNEYNNSLNVLADNSEAVTTGLYNTANNMVMDYDVYISNLDNLAMLSYGNIGEIRDYLKTGVLTGDKYVTSFQSIFEMDTLDYKTVETFNSLRNKILEAAYEKKDINETKKCIENFLTTFVKFVYMGDIHTYNINGQNVDVAYNYISLMAQNTIVDMALGVLTIDHEFSCSNSKVTYKLTNTAEYTNRLAINIMTQLQSKNRSK